MNLLLSSLVQTFHKPSLFSRRWLTPANIICPTTAEPERFWFAATWASGEAFVLEVSKIRWVFFSIISLIGTSLPSHLSSSSSFSPNRTSPGLRSTTPSKWEEIWHLLFSSQDKVMVCFNTFLAVLMMYKSGGFNTQQCSLVSAGLEVDGFQSSAVSPRSSSRSVVSRSQLNTIREPRCPEEPPSAGFRGSDQRGSGSGPSFRGTRPVRAPRRPSSDGVDEDGENQSSGVRAPPAQDWATEMREEAGDPLLPLSSRWSPDCSKNWSHVSGDRKPFHFYGHGHWTTLIVKGGIWSWKFKQTSRKTSTLLSWRHFGTNLLGCLESLSNWKTFMSKF